MLLWPGGLKEVERHILGERAQIRRRRNPSWKGPKAPQLWLRIPGSNSHMS